MVVRMSSQEINISESVFTLTKKQDDQSSIRSQAFLSYQAIIGFHGMRYLLRNILQLLDLLCMNGF